MAVTTNLGITKLVENQAGKVITINDALDALDAAVARPSLVVKTSAYTLTDADVTVLADTTSAGFTLTLPTAVGRLGKLFRIKKKSTDSNTLVIDGAGSETIDGSANITSSATNRPNWTLQSDGSNWWIV